MQTPVTTILDLGCGAGTFGVRFNSLNQYKITGVDIFKPYLKKCLSTGRYVKVVKADLTKKIKYSDKSFDLVVCLETIEHLKKDSGLRLIKEMERIAKKMVIISCPAGVAAQEDYDQNIFQRHLSFWDPKEFTQAGYHVSGIGLKIVYGTHTHVSHKIKFYSAPLYFLSFLANPISNLIPNIACQIIAVKKLNNA